MTVYTMAWGWDDDDPSGQNTAVVGTPDEVDGVLDRIAAGGPTLVDVYEGPWHGGGDTPVYGLQVVWGHPERAALTWLGDEPGFGVDAGLRELPEALRHDQGEALPSRTRVSAAVARGAVREYVRTGKRPALVGWAS
jgi:hypothetical protein